MFPASFFQRFAGQQLLHSPTFTIGSSIKKHIIKISNLVDPKRWHDVLIVLEVDLLLLLFLRAVGQSAVDDEFLLAQGL